MAPRKYSETTIKILFGASGNQCAFPNCTNPVVEPQTQSSDAIVAAQICHIYAASDNGPRGNPNLPEEERNSPSNLILMCGHHHPIIDKQHKEFPADQLIAWKKAHEKRYQQETAEALQLQERMQQNAYLQALSDHEIEKEIERIRKCRYLAGFKTREVAAILADRVEKTELAGGSSEIRARALAWCARLLSAPETVEKARSLLIESRKLSQTSEAGIAEAFIKGGTSKTEALAALSSMNTPEARSAALRIVSNHEKSSSAVAWTKKAALTIDSFDSDGKLLHITNLLETGEWDDAISCATKVTEEDLARSPVLLQAMAMTSLIQAVPLDLREFVISQTPFEAADFPLAADASAMLARERAVGYFDRLSTFAVASGVSGTSNPASDYALWLKLRNPQTKKSALDELRESMRDDKQGLRRIHFALQFGLKLDIPAIERRIDQNIALAGRGTSDEAIARFALAFAQGSPQGVAEYIASHRVQLNEFIQRHTIATIEIEMLARANLIDKAEQRLAEEIATGLGERERDRLRTVLAEAGGADPVTERRKQYELTGSLSDLATLVATLERRNIWKDLRPYAGQLYTKTRALEDAARYAKCLDATGEAATLLSFLSGNPTLVGQSDDLKAMLALSLYRNGQFDKASQVLLELSAVRDNPTDRLLRLNIAVRSGQWSDLIDFTNNEWNNRESRSAKELLTAGELAQLVGGPHAKELVIEAAARADDDAEVLAGAYFHAIGAGWERDVSTSNWLTRAAALSGDDGPLQSITMKELLERKPEWDKHEVSVWDKLNEGSIPIFGAAHQLNRSLVDLTLAQSLINIDEHDPRRRSIIYAFSGTRSGASLRPRTIALDLTAIFTLARLNLLSEVQKQYDEVVIHHSTLGWLFNERQRASFHQPNLIKDAHQLKRLVADGSIRVLQAHTHKDHDMAKEIGLDLTDLFVTAKVRQETGIPSYVVRSAPVHRLGSLLEEEADVSSHNAYLCSCHAVIEKLRAKGILSLPETDGAVAHLKLQERRWPSEPSIADGAELYLDDLSVNYLQAVGVLGKLKAAGLTAYITESKNKEADRLIAFENISQQQIDAIEVIRKNAAEGLRLERVRAVNSTRIDDDEPIKMHPTLSILAIDYTVDALVVDDRFVNRYPHMEIRGRKTPILTSLDILDDLAARNAISPNDLHAYRTSLRQAGFQLLPVTLGELQYHLGNATLSDGKLVETAELRAIRESFLKARMSKMLQLPLEASWFSQSIGSLIRCVKEVWKTIGCRPTEAAAYANWLIKLMDVRGWAPSSASGSEWNFAVFAYAAHVQSLASSPNDVSADVKEAYQDWIEGQILNDLKNKQPEAFDWIVRNAREMITYEADKIANELGQ